MSNIDLNMLLENSLKEREAFLQTRPHFAPYQSDIDAKVSNSECLGDKMMSIAQTINEYQANSTGRI